jgi:hypothetical protein
MKAICSTLEQNKKMNDNCIQSDTTNISKAALRNKLNDHVTDMALNVNALEGLIK